MGVPGAAWGARGVPATASGSLHRSRMASATNDWNICLSGQAASRVHEIERSIAQGRCYDAKSLASTPKGTTRRGGNSGQAEGMLPEMSVAKRARREASLAWMVAFVWEGKAVVWRGMAPSWPCHARPPSPSGRREREYSQTHARSVWGKRQHLKRIWYDSPISHAHLRRRGPRHALSTMRGYRPAPLDRGGHRAHCSGVPPRIA